MPTIGDSGSSGGSSSTGNGVILTDMQWIEQPETDIVIDINGASVSIVGKCQWADVWNFIPEYNQRYDGDGSHLGDLRYKRMNIRKDANGITCTVILQIDGYDDREPRAGQTGYSLSVGTMEKAIETHASYDKGWNYDKLTHGTKETEYFKPGTYDTEHYISDSYTMTSATKAGVESYLFPTPIVEKHKYYSTSSSADNTADNVGTLVAPGKTFGLSSTAAKWLISGAEVRQNGKLWEAISYYQFASDSWDSDLYS